MMEENEVRQLIRSFNQQSMKLEQRLFLRERKSAWGFVILILLAIIAVFYLPFAFLNHSENYRIFLCGIGIVLMFLLCVLAAIWSERPQIENERGFEDRYQVIVPQQLLPEFFHAHHRLDESLLKENTIKLKTIISVAVFLLGILLGPTFLFIANLRILD